ncbi:MAG TPA: vWA domain-containing protein, partial [Tianweitania sediminis]|nr:vWA domain-containing protein [Tianweitania sediminis]
ELQLYARDFFNANLGKLDPNRAQLSLLLPEENQAGGGTLKVSATLVYDSVFFKTFQKLRHKTAEPLSFTASSEVQLKNTVEVALVLDNSGSMDEIGSGSGKKRMVLLKEAAKQLVDALAAQSAQMKQLQYPVQFGLVPFAASVNVGDANANEKWMDTDGLSPIHHENFNWTAFPASNRKVQKNGSSYYKKGSDWGAEENQKVTRFTLFNDLKRITDTRFVKTGTECKRGNSRNCQEWGDVGYEETILGPFAKWQGCVEARPYPYNINDAVARTAAPESLFVPMFAPDETDQKDSSSRPANNNWWIDDTNTSSAIKRQEHTPKYFTAAPEGTAAMGLNEGPNAGCSTKPITPLTDVSTAAGVAAIKLAIDAMEALGGTNVPQGMVWGWRVLSSIAPFTGGRPEKEKGNDKVVIVLTDGANTYYTPESVVANGYSGSGYSRGGNDLAKNESIYSAYGYTKKYDGDVSRIFQGTSSNVSKSNHSNGNYTKAINDHFDQLCNNAKAEGLIVMTVALDLSSRNASEKAQIDALTACASESKFRKSNSGRAAKLFWNATGSSLAEDFKSIADELSNLRIVR